MTKINLDEILKPTPIQTCSKEEYDRLVNENKLTNSTIYNVIDGDSNTILEWAGNHSSILSTSGNFYEDPEYAKDGVRVNCLKDSINAIYEALYNALLANNFDKKDEWKLLLKLNDYDYRLTVLQIETA